VESSATKEPIALAGRDLALGTQGGDGFADYRAADAHGGRQFLLGRQLGAWKQTAGGYVGRDAPADLQHQAA
jgi:hypothetical protein